MSAVQSILNRRQRFTVVCSWLVAAAIGSHGCAGVQTSIQDNDELVNALKAIHQPVYDIYAKRLDRDGLHGHLGQSFVGEALTEAYVEHFTTLSRMETEETAIEILDVAYGDAQVLSIGVHPRILCQWQVSGVITHGGHAHARTNAYSAVFTLADTQAGWRISDTKMKDLERLKIDTNDDIEFSRGRDASGGGDSSLLELIRAGKAPERAEETQ